MPDEQDDLRRRHTCHDAREKMCDHKQSFTQYGGARPWHRPPHRVDTDGIHLFETDPSGAYQSYHAGAIGKGGGGHRVLRGQLEARTRSMPLSEGLTALKARSTTT